MAMPTTPVPEEKTARTWAMLCHLLALTWLLGILPGIILGPLIVWLIKKDEYPFVDDQGKESLNFQISMLLYLAISGLLCFLVIGFVLVPAVAIFEVIMTIIATIHANDGEYYRYPLTIRFIN